MLEPTLGWLLEKMAQKVPAQEAIIFEDQGLTYAQLAERANRLANALSELKVGKGDKVALLLYNCPQFLEAVFGAAKTGAVCVPLNYRLKANELAYILAHSNSSVLIYDGEFTPEVEFLKKELKNLKHYLVVGENGNDQCYAELLKGASTGSRTGVDSKENDVATIMYTAGTTGLPKGVMLTHRNHLWSCINSIP